MLSPFKTIFSPKVDEEGLQIITSLEFYHLNYMNYMTLFLETDISPLEMPVLIIPVHSDGSFNV